jgi:hypothetical protein
VIEDLSDNQAAPETPPKPVLIYDWVFDVACPACGVVHEVSEEEKKAGLRCKKCGIGWVPKGGSRRWGAREKMEALEK